MKKPLQNSKSFWQNDFVLEIKKQRHWIEYLTEKKRIENSKFSTKIMKFLKKMF